jgi:hypothetical protein
MMDPMLEILLFKVGGVSYGLALGQVEGLIRDLPNPESDEQTEEAQVLLFDGRDVPVFPATDLLQQVGPGCPRSREAIIINDGRGLFGIAVDCTESVVSVTPGSDLYTLPPQEYDSLHPCRPWGILTVGERPVMLLDVSQVSPH